MPGTMRKGPMNTTHPDGHRATICPTQTSPPPNSTDVAHLDAPGGDLAGDCGGPHPRHAPRGAVAAANDVGENGDPALRGGHIVPPAGRPFRQRSRSGGARGGSALMSRIHIREL